MPTILDLFCGAGGMAMGYYRAGFDVLGVDTVPQPRYPFPFRLGDARTTDLSGVDAIHASPPCQRWASCTWDQGSKPDLIAPIRKRLELTGLPYVIENVPFAPLRRPVMLCGSMFGLDVQRHRDIETNWVLPRLKCNHASWTPKYPPNRSNLTRPARVVSVAGHGGPNGADVHLWRRVMDIDWMTVAELAQAMPPAYGHYVGTHLLKALSDGTN